MFAIELYVYHKFGIILQDVIKLGRRFVCTWKKTILCNPLHVFFYRYILA